MVEGGVHPKSNVQVTKLDESFTTSITRAATIFYRALTMCLTESSDFVTARYCMLNDQDLTFDEQETVAAAWDAVGVKPYCPFDRGEVKEGLNLTFRYDVQVYLLNDTSVLGKAVSPVV